MDENHHIPKPYQTCSPSEVARWEKKESKKLPKKMQQNNNDELMICNILGIILKQSKQLIYI